MKKFSSTLSHPLPSPMGGGSVEGLHSAWRVSGGNWWSTQAVTTLPPSPSHGRGSILSKHLFKLLSNWEKESYFLEISSLLLAEIWCQPMFMIHVDPVITADCRNWMLLSASQCILRIIFIPQSEVSRFDFFPSAAIPPLCSSPKILICPPPDHHQPPFSSPTWNSIE